MFKKMKNNKLENNNYYVVAIVGLVILFVNNNVSSTKNIGGEAFYKNLDLSNISDRVPQYKENLSEAMTKHYACICDEVKTGYDYGQCSMSIVGECIPADSCNICKRVVIIPPEKANI